jgi:hypothetical protein
MQIPCRKIGNQLNMAILIVSQGEKGGKGLVNGAQLASGRTIIAFIPN